MASMEGVLIDKLLLNPNGASGLAVDGGFGKIIHHNCSYSSISSWNDRHLQLGHRSSNIYGSHGFHAPPPSPVYYSSPPLHLPPLLPLPSSKSAPSSKKADFVNTENNISSVRMGDRPRNKRRPVAGSKIREPSTTSTNIALRVSQSNNKLKRGEESKESVISPPPSSLPLPSLALRRIRAAMVISRGDDGGVSGSGAKHSGASTDELRRLLRL
ncbi:hypothetical protein Cni_G07537 [Canna indica]|uniref:Uncharacterized protein n=1 Tax=Canna indica TaxID=4628 RepID=A0AAQ3K454_9LILI|nr:hypothetical protein Cni_G07537 [Canna indica]